MSSKKKRRKKQAGLAAEFTKEENETPVGITFDRQENGDFKIRGVSAKDETMIMRAFAQKYGNRVAATGTIPKEAVQMLDENGDEIKDYEEYAKDPDRNKEITMVLRDQSIIPDLAPTTMTRRPSGHDDRVIDFIKSLRESEERDSNEEPGQAAVQTYLYALERLLEGARNDKGAIRSLSGDDPQRGIELSRVLWARMRNARIFEIPVSTYLAFYKTASAEIDRKYPGEGTLSSKDMDILGRDLPFPEELPFENVYLGIGSGMNLIPEQGLMRVHSSQHHKVRNVRLLGFVISAEPQEVYELCSVETGDDNFIVPGKRYYLGSWDTGRMMTPWVINDVIDLLNSHRVVVEKGPSRLSMKVTFRRQNKATGTKAMPPPYYTIRMKDSYREAPEETNEGGRKGQVLSYRHDREAHERVLVRRGALPIDPEDREKLEKRGYRVVTGRLSAEDYERLSKRRKAPKRVDEWIAVKAIRIEQTIIGNPSLPYVPGSRVPQIGKDQKVVDRRTIPSILNPGAV